MVNIKLESGWFLLENKVLFGATVPNNNYINLALEVGENIINENPSYSMIEFPGEYDIDGVWAKALAGKDGKLNFLLNLKWRKFGIIQSPKILEEDEVSGMDYRLYLDDKVEKKIDQLELEGKTLKLDWEGWTLEVDMKDDEAHEEIDVKVSNTKWETPEVELD